MDSVRQIVASRDFQLDLWGVWDLWFYEAYGTYVSYGTYENYRRFLHLIHRQKLGLRKKAFKSSARGQQTGSVAGSARSAVAG